MNPLRQHIESLPELIGSRLDAYVREAGNTIDDAACQDVQSVVAFGCGDSYYAGVCTASWIEAVSGLEARAHAAMDVARYRAIGRAHAARTLAIGVSVSGGVSRTVEAVRAVRRAGARAIAVSSAATTPVGSAAERVAQTLVPDLPIGVTLQVPGSRSFYASMLMLCLLAARLADGRGARDRAEAARSALRGLPRLISTAIELADGPMLAAARETVEAGVVVFAGSGPNLGSAHFGSAKLIEACGDAAIASDIEEWAHVHYWMKQADTPTFLLSRHGSGWREASRAQEVEAAMRAVGRRVIRPTLPDCAEELSPFVACIPPLLYAAHRAEMLGEPYFRAFGGGRSIEGGGGISRIRTSEVVDVSD